MTETQDDITDRSQLSAVLHRAGRSAYPAGEYVGQESFVTASEALTVAHAAGVTAGARVLELCCGTGGLGLYLVRRTGCRLVGIDRSRHAVQLGEAATRAEPSSPRPVFLAADATALPVTGRFDAVLLFETMLAIRDKLRLLQEIRRVLRPGARFGLTLEAGEPLSPEERQRIPEGEAIFLVSEREFMALLVQSGFSPRLVEDRTAEHLANVRRLARVFRQDPCGIAAQLGTGRYRQFLAAYRQWERWLAGGRVRKLAMVAERLA